MLVDGTQVETINSGVIDTQWTWLSSSFVLPDVSEHILGIRLEENNTRLDKIYIDGSSASPTGDGPSLTTSPFVTIHTQIYETENSLPTTPLLVYDWKTTRDEIKKDDWYHFNISAISDSVIIDYNSVYAIVLSSSGGSNINFVVWELVDNDEYLILPSAVKTQ